MLAGQVDLILDVLGLSGTGQSMIANDFSLGRLKVFAIMLKAAFWSGFS
jgi:hypothetical protein